MPRIARLDRLFVKPNNQWSPFPKRPLPFRIPEWETTKHRKHAKVTKIQAPSMIPSITPYKEWPIIRGDLVEVMVGQDKGKQGKVRVVARRKNLVKIMGMNMSENFVDNMGDGKPGYMLNEEPLHYSDIKLVDPFTGKGTDVVFRYDENGAKVRTCKESGRIIPKPTFERLDWKSRSAVKEGDNDTKSDIVQQYTYVPSLLFFHEEIMIEYDIPMTISKTSVDRRDLIFNELESEAYKEREIAYANKPKPDSSIMGQLKAISQNVMFWKK